jgi:hypothetical protein
VITLAGYTCRNRLMRGEWREIDVFLPRMIVRA